MSESSDLLVEIGTEELPPTALHTLCTAFETSLGRSLEENHLVHGGSKGYAAPRRLAVLVRNVPLSQPDREVVRRGPALQAAFDEDGNPTKPAEGFAKSCGVTVAELDQLETDKGSFLARRSVEPGRTADVIIPGLVEQTLKSLPIPRRMRWGAGEEEFVRPVHWVLLLLGDQVLEADILGIHSGGTTRGHRFHCNETLTISRPDDYLKKLEHPGHVLVDMDRRREAIRTQITEAGEALGGITRIDADLLDEVTALVEWPVAITGAFEERFLEVPPEALVSSMQDHQKFFPVVDNNGELLPHFIAVANIVSSDPQQVQAGNERVIRPRLEDAEFFWKQDRKVTLESRAEKLADVIFQQQLGSLGDKQRRIATLATIIAETAGFNTTYVQRAAALCKCDLLTSMVYEFPELQGTMGRYYARHDDEPVEVAAALDEQYQPRFAGDDLPSTATGQAIAIADRLDTLAGIFAIGKPPTGDKDPFGLRRAALGVLRILIEQRLDLDLLDLINTAVEGLPGKLGNEADAADVFNFMLERLRTYYLESGYDTLEFEAVLALRPTRPLDFDQRMRAVRAFRNLPESENLAAANKRIRNILRQAENLEITTYPAKVDAVLFKEDAEKALDKTIRELDNVVNPMFEQRDYTNALCKLAALQAPVDRFFDDVMVMDEDTALRDNRLALLSALSELFLQVADISRLQN
ncbi:MAG: glycine--tRNA ligase subunit beta [Gammaproteobacteria bacterium]|nr:MAG: glycine--tRNA ligase subunit beta [Gammaproteobacteria bacterium]